MNILLIGGVFDKKIEELILNKSKGIVHYAANKLQWNLVDGFLDINNLQLEILSAPFIGSYPKEFKDASFKGYKSKYKGRVPCQYIGFNNIWGYRNLSKKKNLKRSIKKFATDRANDKVICVYSPHTPFLQAAVYAKKIDPSIHICLIVPDLPHFMNLTDKQTLIYKSLKSIDIKIFENNSKFVDSFVLLTDPMKKILNVGKRPYIVMEGIVNTEHVIDKEENNDSQNINNITLVYTGTLNKKFGVVNLVEAFHNTTIKNAQLKICGRGDSEEIIKRYAAKDARITFLGQLPNSEALKLQEMATILINPRQNNELFTKYSFPSKNMEYLLTGKPVIAYKLDGIPDEYDNYFYYVQDDSIETLSKKIEEVLSMDEKSRKEIGKAARNFVLKNKNNISACKKIIHMIEESRIR